MVGRGKNKHGLRFLSSFQSAKTTEPHSNHSGGGKELKPRLTYSANA